MKAYSPAALKSTRCHKALRFLQVYQLYPFLVRMSGKSRQRSNTGGSQDLSRPRSAQPKKNPRKLVEKIDDLRRKGAEVDSAFHEVMGIRTEVRDA